MVTGFKNLTVWQKAHDLFVQVAEDVRSFPKNRTAWVLEDQLVRAANSIGANIAEGYGRKTNKEFRQFLGVAKGSTSECIDQYLKIAAIKYLSQEIVDKRVSLLNEIDKMLRSLMYKVGA